jgi:hypothetical protein
MHHIKKDKYTEILQEVLWYFHQVYNALFVGVNSTLSVGLDEELATAIFQSITSVDDIDLLLIKFLFI